MSYSFTLAAPAFSSSQLAATVARWAPIVLPERYAGSSPDIPGGHEAHLIAVVLVGEADRLLALGADRHTGHDRVVLLGQQYRDDAVPVLRHQLALQLYPLAQRQRDVDVDALELARFVEVIERRIVSFRSDAQRGGTPRSVSAPPAANSSGAMNAATNPEMIRFTCTSSVPRGFLVESRAA